MTPQRIQRKRTKGWKMPENCVSVTRPGKWGNPFKLMGDMIYVDASHRRKIFDPWVCYYGDGGHTAVEVVNLFRDMLMDLNNHPVEPEIYARFKWMRDRIMDLQGKHLACFCALDEWCHADVLLEYANQPTG